MSVGTLSPEAQKIKDEVEYNGGSFLPNEYTRTEKAPLPPESDKIRFLAPDDPKELINLNNNEEGRNDLADAIKKQCTIVAIKEFITRTDIAAENALEKYISLQKKFLAKAIIESLIGPLEMLVTSPAQYQNKIDDFIKSCKIKKPELIVELIKQCLPPKENTTADSKGNTPQQFSPIIINNNLPQAPSPIEQLKANIIDAAN